VEIEQVKKDWELNRLKQLKEEEERKAEEQDDDEMMYTYAKTEVRNTKPSKKSLKNLKKSHAKQLASSWQKSLLTSKTNTYLAETRPKRAAQGTAAPGSSSQNKACSSRLLKKAVAISCGGSGSPQKTTADKGMRKTISYEVPQAGGEVGGGGAEGDEECGEGEAAEEGED